MSAQPRVSGVELYHHIYAWGNDRHPIFKDDNHYQTYLNLLAIQSTYCKVDVIAYALMEWHIHLFVYDKENKLSEFMQRLHGDYARFYNHCTKRTGHVFGERFNNKLVQFNNYGLRLTRYIHRQALAAGLVGRPEDYAWTSYRIYIGAEKNPAVKSEVILDQFGKKEDANAANARYEEFVLAKDNDKIDWDSKSFMVIGDDNYLEVTKKLIKKKKSPGNMKKIKDRIFLIVQNELKLDMQMLLKPKGRAQRKIRHDIFNILVKEYGFTRSSVAIAFNLSTMGISKVLIK